MVFGGVTALSYMETEQFCSRCHTMSPQVTAHLNSPHQSVECTECHVGDGVKALARSKLDGMQQMIKLITGDYARPIPPAAHDMPPATETCLHCHDPAKQAGDLLLARSVYQDDQANTEQRTALVVRLADDKDEQTAGIHWHVESKVEYIASDEDKKTIDWIGVEKPDGTHEEYIAENVIEISEQASRKAEELRKAGDPRRMSCYDCHNRVGHEFTPPGRAMDAAMSEGLIDTGLPYIKSWGMEVLDARYSSLDSAFRAINGLAASYHRSYPYVFLERAEGLEQSLRALTDIYARTASPEMDEAAEDYPSYLGHTDSAGCFRCHDGGHYKIVDGALSDEPIPSRCSTCHTFPSVGSSAPNAMIGPPPESHQDRLWVFTHKEEARSLEVSGTTCSSCHSQTYCTNCHSSGAASVNHDDMFFAHAKVIKASTQQPCAYCHQRPFCVRCHQDDGVEIKLQ